MQKLERVNQWTTLLTNVGVIVGIVLLILEINQNTVAIDNQIDVAVSSIGTGHASMLVADAELAELFVRAESEAWDEFSPVEQFRIGLFWSMLIDRVHLQFSLFERRSQPLTVDNIVFPESLLSQVAFRTWYEEARHDTTYERDVIEFFDSYIAERGN